MEMTNTLTAFLKEHLQTEAPSEKHPNIRSHRLTQGDYVKAAKEHGLTEDTLKAVHNFKKSFVSSLANYGAEQLAERIKEAKKKGEDPSDLVENFVVRTHDGKLELDVFAQQTYNVHNPREPNSPVSKLTKYGVVRIKSSEKRTQEEEEMNKISASIEKAFA